MNSKPEVSCNSQNYVKWNEAFVRHFFNEGNFGKEVILYNERTSINRLNGVNTEGIEFQPNFILTRYLSDFDHESV
ncbi:hypothetical protein GCM10011416_00970 [Polaribacter pacificus]|uniref:Uncharacterized protein n=1 Tax=Polaribacter pacificus TaxID=1775173 RepID=A0A917HT70_9FLAO|nr:hypothetical protein [Polaribacter pacificus]GGG88523.1 hypothetical protein GCM10011416_00970 [Polaribacter pacificus]